MIGKREGKFIDTTSHTLVAEKKGVKLYRNRSNTFFLVVPHVKGDMNFNYDGFTVTSKMMARSDDITIRVSAEYAENWVKKNCPKCFDHLYDWGKGKTYNMLIPFSADESKKLNRIIAHDEMERTRTQIVKDVVQTWLNDETEKIDSKMK